MSLLVAGGIWPADTPSGTTSFTAILTAELNREFMALKAKADPPPYYMAYEATEEQTDSASATLGALVEDTHSHNRGVDTTIRVGSPKFDNYHPLKGSRGQVTRFTMLSLDDDPNEINRQLWAETDNAYRLASRRLLQLKTDEQLLADQATTDADFSAESPQTYSQLPERFSYDHQAWDRRVRKWSSEFKNHPAVMGSEVTFRAEHEIRTFVNTEGTSIQRGNNLFRIEISGGSVASDGMELSDFTSVEVADPSHIPDDKVVLKKVQDLAKMLDNLAVAPPAEPIVCPAILSGRASAVFFHEIFGHRVEGHRQKDISEGQTFTKMLGTKVLPDFISVDFDPTMRTYEGKDLIGYYEYDDEGVKAAPVKVVQDGVLKTFLLSRSPVGDFVHSNGHGRRQPGYEIVSRQSNLIVESSKKVTSQELRARLIDEIKKQNKPYGLYFDEVSSGYTTTGRRGLQAFTVVPLVVYRVFADGRPDELIRGVDIVGTPLASFQKIIATSDTAEIFNGYCGAESGSIPVSAVSPAILVSEIETEKKQNSQRKMPILPRPEAE
jgi:predicted Zn-dependent protease